MYTLNIQVIVVYEKILVFFFNTNFIQWKHLGKNQMFACDKMDLIGWLGVKFL